MNIPKFIVLGALEAMGEASGYDIIRFAEKKMLHRWTRVKNGSIYNALKSLDQSGDVRLVERVKQGLFPTMTLYRITEQGRNTFDALQEECFKGLFPLHLGFKLGLKLNHRRTRAEIRQYADEAITIIDTMMKEAADYLETLPGASNQKSSDAFFIEHDRMLLREEKKWIAMVRNKIDSGEADLIDGL